MIEPTPSITYATTVSKHVG